MKKRIITLLVLTSISLNITMPVWATNSLDDSKAQFNQVSSDIKDLDDKMAELDNEISEIEGSIKENQKKISNLENDISNTEVKIKSLEKDIESNKALLSTRLREMYKKGSTSGIDMVVYILESSNLSELFSRIHATKTIVDYDNKIIDDNNKMVDSLTSAVENLQNEKSSLNELNETINKNLEDVQAKKSTLADTKSKLEAEKANIANAIKENEEKLISHQVSIVNSSNPSANELNEAIMTLDSLLPQLSVESVKNTASNAISKAKNLLAEMKSKVETKPSIPNASEYKKTYEMEATAYSGHSITALGVPPVRNENGLSTVAVDKSVIPLGSKVYVVGYGYAIASDTGSAIVGNKIDLYMNSKEECYQFGRRKVTVHVIAYPNEW